MYSTRTGLVLGFHGCDASIATEVLNGKSFLKKSENTYDWLGHGVYFWENNNSRALDFSENLKSNPQRSKTIIQNPGVIGAVIDLGHCLDLLDHDNIQLLKLSYKFLKENLTVLPINKRLGGLQDLILRDLDCAVIEILHGLNEFDGKPSFDSVRAVFTEGEEIYEGAGFREKDHIQICIRNPNCIKGFFLPRALDNNYSKV